MPVMKLDAVVVADRLRSLKPEKVNELALSIETIGLLNPICVTKDKHLVSGLHRLEAHRLLGRKTIEYRTVSLEDAKKRLAEIDENLARAELNDIELGDHILMREELLDQLGLLARRGDNIFTMNTATTTTKDIAAKLNYSTSSVHLKKRIARDLAPDVKQRLVNTRYASNTTGLLKLAKQSPHIQRLAVELLLDGNHRELRPAIRDALGQDNKKTLAKSLKRFNNAASDVVTLYKGDFRRVGAKVKDESVDLIWCDPPYVEAELYEHLAVFAARVLKPGGSCFAYAGQSRLPQVLAYMGKHLRYWWTLSLNLSSGVKAADHGRNVFIFWKPIVWYVKGDKKQRRRYVPDNPTAEKPEYNKQLHRWEQDVSTPQFYIGNLTKPGSLICDPMMGTGTTGVAAMRCACKFLGVEKDKDSFALAKKRLDSSLKP